MATITKRSNNLGDATWQVKIRRKGFPAVSKTFDSKSRAEAWASQIESEMSRGVFMDRTEAQRNTLGDLLSRYVEQVSPQKRARSRAVSNQRADSNARHLQVPDREPFQPRDREVAGQAP